MTEINARQRNHARQRKKPAHGKDSLHGSFLCRVPEHYTRQRRGFAVRFCVTHGKEAMF
jgi:hypothetical protein